MTIPQSSAYSIAYVAVTHDGYIRSYIAQMFLKIKNRIDQFSRLASTSFRKIVVHFKLHTTIFIYFYVEGSNTIINNKVNKKDKSSFPLN